MKRLQGPSRVIANAFHDDPLAVTPRSAISWAGPSDPSVMIWLQARDIHAEHDRLAAAGVRILREPVAEP
jgi:hypothetical protein